MENEGRPAEAGRLTCSALDGRPTRETDSSERSGQPSAGPPVPEDGAAADPARFETVTPSWGAGDTIHLGKRTLRVLGIRDDDSDAPPVLVVEEST
jgi:hypothetical protein